jgi:hypothetical protein
MIRSLCLCKKAKALFDELVVVSWSVSLKSFNLYVFCGL